MNVNKPIRAADEFFTNIKGLPDGQYLTETGYSQSYPWKVVGVSASGKTMTIAKVTIARDPEWKPDVAPGGFCGHCSNQSEQTWLYDGVDESCTRKVRLKKSPYIGSDKMWGDANGGRYVANQAVEFYDYNF